MPISRQLRLLLNFVVGPLLFLLIAFSIYQQLRGQEDLAQHWQRLRAEASHRGLGWIIAAILLVGVNWGIESYKWKRLVDHVMPVSFLTAIKSVLAGVSFTMLTPNRMGEFLGRVMYMPDGSRIRAATLTLLGSMSQLIITMVAGCIGLLLIRPSVRGVEEWSDILTNALLFGTCITLLVIVILYFNIGWLIRNLEKWAPLRKYAYFIHLVGEIKAAELLSILLLSLMRYSIFLLQYWLVFRYLNVNIASNELMAATAVMFLILAIIPTISLAELGVRGKVSLFVFGVFVPDTLAILVITAIIWLINIILPAIAGSLMWLRVKLLGKESVT